MNIQPVPVLTNELGLRPLKGTPKRDTQEIAIERLGDIDAHVIFVTGNPPAGGYEPDRSEQRGLRSAPTWKRLRAVRAERVFDYPVDLVFGGPAADAALLELLTDQLTRA